MAEESKYGFKDKSKALETIELLKSKELAYQKLTVRGLLGRAKRVLTCEFLGRFSDFIAINRFNFEMRK